MHIDKRRNYYLVVDVETANTLGQPLVYDLGFAIMDTRGEIYESYSYAIRDIFFDEKKIFHNWRMMKSAYYSEKLPVYYEGIFGDVKEWEVKSIYYARKVIENLILKYNVKAICAYNASFDVKALTNTIKYVSKSELAEFFPKDIQVYDIWHMACQTIAMKVGYAKFCYENELYSDAGNCRTNAETMYAYLIDSPTFEESHTGLADVLIECKIMASVLKMHKSYEKGIKAFPWRIPQEHYQSVVSRYY